MVNRRVFLKNLVAAFSAQGAAFICSVLMSLVVPKLLGVEEYGYYQLFIFYTSYMSFFALGLNDGVYLEHGGESREELDKSLIRSELMVGWAYQLLFALAIVAYALLFGDGAERAFVLCSAAAFLLISNTVYYVGYVFQAMNETRRFSFATIIDRLVFLVPLGVCVALRVTDFRVYVVAYLVARTVALAYSLWHARDILRAPLLPVPAALGAAWGSIRTGIVLTVANVSFMLIMGFARFVIDGVWGIEAFSRLSFALSLVNFALAFISQASMVLFPALRQSDADALRRYYHMLRSGLCTLLPFSYLLYYPLRLFAAAWLPQYGPSLDYLIYLMPICVFGVQNNIVYNTFYKVRNEPRKLLAVNVRALAISAAGVLVGAFVIRDIIAVVLFAVAGIASCLVMSDRYLSACYGEREVALPLGSLAVTTAFITLNAALPFWHAAAASCAVLVIFAVTRRRALCDLARRIASLVAGHRHAM